MARRHGRSSPFDGKDCGRDSASMYTCRRRLPPRWLSGSGTPAVITVSALAMHDQGYPFLLTTNGVWLTRVVPAKFLDLP